MKRKLFIAVLAIVVTAAGCTNKTSVPEKVDFTIITSFYPIYIIALNVADGIAGVKVLNMTPSVTGCLHDYSITAEDMKNLQEADILLVNGSGMEFFMDRIARKYSGLKIAELTGGIALIRHRENVNPHVWVSVSNAILMAGNCAKALAENNPENKAAYRDNADRYIKKLNDLKTEMHRRLDKYRGRKIITFHEAFPYFAKEFGLEVTAVIEREPGSQPSARELADTVETVRKFKIKALFAEPQYPSSSADIISKETGAKMFILDPAVTGGDEKEAYLNIMKKNMSVIEQAFE